MLLARNGNPAIENREVEMAFLRLDLLPGDRHQDGIDVHAREPGKDFLGLRGGAGGRISELTAQEEKRLAVNIKLLETVVRLDCGQLLAAEQGNEQK